MPLSAALGLLITVALVGPPAAPATPDPDFPAYGFSRSDTFKLQADMLTADVGVADGASSMGSWTRVEIRNAGFAPERAVVRFDRFVGRAGDSSVERAVTVAPRGSAAFIVWIPQALQSGHVSLLASSGDLDTHSFYSGGGSTVQVVAVGTEASFTEAVGRPAVESTETPLFRVTTLPAELLPEELMSYSAMSVVYLGETRLEQLTGGQRHALEAYVAVGGHLALGSCGPLTLSHLPLLKALPSGPAVPYGFGEVQGCGVRGSPLLKFFAEGASLPGSSGSGQPLPYSGSFLGPRPADLPSGNGTPLLPEAAPPVGTYYAIVVAFALLVGPGSLGVVRRWGSIWLLVTLPGAALLTSLGMIGSALAGNGLQTLASLRAVTLLDSEHGRAISVGMGAFFSGRTPPEVHVPLTAAWYPQDGSLSVDPAYTLRSGFIPARVYKELSLSQVSATRARVVMRKRGEGLLLQNALGGDVGRVYFQEGGKRYVTGAIRDGGEGMAHVETAEPIPHDPWPLPQLLLDRVLENLTDGDFVALTEGAGFLPLPIEGMSLRERRTQQWVRGRLQR